MKRSKSNAACKELKSALLQALQLAGKGVDELPIAGAKGCTRGVLKIIEKKKFRRANMKTFKDLVDIIIQLESVIVVRLSEDRDILDGVKNNVERFASKLRDVSARYNKRVTIQRVKDLFILNGHAKTLNRFGEDLKNAILEFQTSDLSLIQLMNEKRVGEDLITKLTVKSRAIFTAPREHQNQFCEPGTRVSLLEDVTKWAEGTGPNHPSILWLHGPAGIGKSTVARTLAKQFDDRKTLGGSFMFSKPHGVTDGSKVTPTLTFQLANHLPEFRRHLVTAIQSNKRSRGDEITQQFEDLLARPLSQAKSSPITMIVLDALDECTPESLTPLLIAIAENTIHFPYIRFLVTSRPESYIREALQHFRERIHEVDMSDIVASQDIEIYLQKRLREANGRFVDDASQNQAWPADMELASLVNMADNLFIFAETVVRFICDERAMQPRHRLEIILRAPDMGHNHPFFNLDTLYREILRNALAEGKDKCFQAVVGTIIFSRVPISVNSLLEILAQEHTTSDIRHLLKTLRSVLRVPDEGGKYDLWVQHKSFVDFITDLERCAPMTEVYLHPPTHHAKLCFRHLKMAELMFNTLPHATQSDTEYMIAHGSRAEIVLYKTSFSLTQWLYHLHTFRDQALNTNTNQQQVILPVLQKAQAFLALLGKYDYLYGSARGHMNPIYEETPSHFYTIQDSLQEGVGFCRNNML